MFKFYDKILSENRLKSVESNFVECKFIPDPENLMGLTTLENFIIETSWKNSKEVLESMEKSIDSETTEESQKLKLMKFLGEFDRYIKLISEDSFFKVDYSYFVTDLINVKSELQEKYTFLTPDNMVQKPLRLKSSNKIKWTAGVASLGSLFYKLIFENKTSNNEAYISQPVDDVIDFILEHFTDSKGEPFTRSSLIKYISDTKTGRQKRAKVKSDIIIN